MSLTIERYSEKSYVVRGNTREHKDLLKEHKLRYNSALHDGPGWIFPSSRLEEVSAALGDHVKGEVIETNPLASRSFTFERLPAGTQFICDERTDRRSAAVATEPKSPGVNAELFTLVEMNDDCILTLEDEEKGAHTAHYIPSLQKWLIATEERFSLVELNK